MKRFENWYSKNKNLYLFLLVLLILDRIILFVNFSFKYVGSDDMIFWQSATDYMNGVFHEPYFYGQNYNFMLESIFAAPFLFLGVPYSIIFPVCTSILSLLPFVYFSVVLFRRGFEIEGMFFIIIPLLLPIEYGMLTSMTRGFVTGLFFTAFMAIPLLNPTKKTSWLIAAFAFAFGYILNPNSLIFSLPIFVYLFLNNFKQFSFYLINLIAIVPVLLIEYFSKQFYVRNDEFNVHGMWNLHFSFEMLLKDFSQLDKFFGYFMPVIWPAGWIILIILLLGGLKLLKLDFKKGFSLLFSIFFILISLGINKVNDNLGTIFLSSTRMYLGIPLLTGLAFFWCKKMLKLQDNYLKTTLVIVAVTVFFCKSNVYPAVIGMHKNKNNQSMPIKNISELKCECAKLDSIANKENIDLIIFVYDSLYNIPYLEFYNYGCPLLEKKFPKTMMNLYERRTWVYLTEKSRIEPNILIFNYKIDSNQIKMFPKLIELSGVHSLTLINENKIRTDSLLKKLKIPLARNSY